MGPQNVQVCANLIKIWFRELPDGLLNIFDNADIQRLSNLDVEKCDESVEFISGIQEPNRSLLIWLLDVMAHVVVEENVNKMSAKNMAIVVAPNLYQLESDNPMVALTKSQEVHSLLQFYSAPLAQGKLNSICVHFDSKNTRIQSILRTPANILFFSLP